MTRCRGYSSIQTGRQERSRCRAQSGDYSDSKDFRYRACWGWRDNDFFEAARRPSRRRAFKDARERFLEIAFFLALRPRLTSAAAFFLVASDVFPLAGGGSFTPSRRALERPIAIACFVERAPCLPRRTCSISSRTNSPAWVDGALPSRLALRALLRVCFSAIMHLEPGLLLIYFYAFAVRETGTNKDKSRKMQLASIWLIPLSSRLAFDLVKKCR